MQLATGENPVSPTPQQPLAAHGPGAWEPLTLESAFDAHHALIFRVAYRMTKRPYFVDGSGPFGQGHDDDIRGFNKPPAGQPGLWCWWEPAKDGAAIKWNGVEKFYNSEAWMSYLIDLFLKPGAVLASELDRERRHVRARGLMRRVTLRRRNGN